MKKNPKRYTISRRANGKWQLQIRDNKPPFGFGLVYGGIYNTKEEAEKAVGLVWGLTVYKK